MKPLDATRPLGHTRFHEVMPPVMEVWQVWGAPNEYGWRDHWIQYDSPYGPQKYGFHFPAVIPPNRTT
jgi:hypothetical protein